MTYSPDGIPAGHLQQIAPAVSGFCGDALITAFTAQTSPVIATRYATICFIY
jgi:hypothetical protein